MLHLHTPILTIMLIALVCLPAYGAESIFIVPSQQGQTTESLTQDIVSLLKQANLLQQKSQISMRNYNSAQNSLEKRLWLITVVADEIGRVSYLTEANKLTRIQTKSYAKQNKEMIARLSHPRVQNELQGLKAMLSVLNEEESSKHLSTLVSIIEKQYAIPRPAHNFVRLLELQKAQQISLNKQLAQLKNYYFEITRGGLI